MHEGASVLDLIKPDGRCWAHHCCAAWSDGVCLSAELELINVDKALLAASRQRCDHCHRLGASVKCWVEGCRRLYHYPCAPVAGTFQDVRSLSLLCPDHIYQAVAVAGEEANCVMCERPGDLSNQMFCTSCGQHYHSRCLDIVPGTAVRAGWQCPECKICQNCRQPGDDGKMLVCDACDKGFHTYCLRPAVNSIPQNSWKCQHCSVCGDCGTCTPADSTDPRWRRLDGSLCNQCQQQRADGLTCPLCRKAWGNRPATSLLLCRQCRCSVHPECDKSSPSDAPEYICPLCQSRSSYRERQKRVPMPSRGTALGREASQRQPVSDMTLQGPAGLIFDCSRHLQDRPSDAKESSHHDEQLWPVACKQEDELIQGESTDCKEQSVRCRLSKSLSSPLSASARSVDGHEITQGGFGGLEFTVVSSVLNKQQVLTRPPGKNASRRVQDFSRSLSLPRNVLSTTGGRRGNNHARGRALRGGCGGAGKAIPGSQMSPKQVREAAELKIPRKVEVALETTGNKLSSEVAVALNAPSERAPSLAPSSLESTSPESQQAATTGKPSIFKLRFPPGRQRVRALQGSGVVHHSRRCARGSAHGTGRGRGRGGQRSVCPVGVAAKGGQPVEMLHKKEEQPEDAMPNAVVLFSTFDKFTLKQDMCVVCGSFGRGAEGRLLACSQCGQCYHPYCVGIKITRVVLRKGWRCLECTACETCGLASDPGRLLLCDDCDISFHIYCLQPQLFTVPTGGWKCSWCVCCIQCGGTSPGLGCEWQSNYTQCAPCASLATCPVCSQNYSPGDLVLQCRQCDRWLHASCEEMQTEEEVEKAADAGFDCCFCCSRRGRLLEPPRLYTQDGVCLTECGMNQLQRLSLSPGGRPRPRLKRKQASSVDSDTDPGHDADFEQVGSEVSKEDVEAAANREKGTTDGKQGHYEGQKKKKRKLYRPGVGGFLVRCRLPKSAPRGSSINRLPTGQKEMLCEAARCDSSSEEGLLGSEAGDRVRPKLQGKRTRLEDSFPPYLQEAFFGKSLLESARERRLSADGLSDEAVPIPPDSNVDQVKELVRPDIPPAPSTQTVEPSEDSQGKSDMQGVEQVDDPLMDLSEDILGILSEPAGPVNLECNSGTKANRVPAASAAFIPEPLDSAFLTGDLDRMVPAELTRIEGKEVEDLFTALNSQGQAPTAVHSTPASQSPSVQPSVPSPAAGRGSFPNVPVSIARTSPSGLIGSPGVSSTPFHVDDIRADAPNQFPAVAPVNIPPIEGTWPAGQASTEEREGDGLTYNQRSALKWERDEELAEMATISAVLYANINFPNLKQDFPEWSTRAKQIAKLWRKASTEERAPYLQKARDNRAALRITRAQNSVKPRKRASADPLQSLAPSELDSYVSKQTSLGKEQLRLREVEQEQEWKLRQQLRMQSKQQAKLEANQKLELAKQEQQRQQIQGTDTDNFPAVVSSPTHGRGDKLQAFYSASSSPPRTSTTENTFAKPQTPSIPSKTIEALPQQHTAVPTFLPSPKIQSSVDPRPISPWDPYSRMPDTPIPQPPSTSASEVPQSETSRCYPSSVGGVFAVPRLPNPTNNEDQSTMKPVQTVAVVSCVSTNMDTHSSGALKQKELSWKTQKLTGYSPQSGRTATSSALPFEAPAGLYSHPKQFSTPGMLGALRSGSPTIRATPPKNSTSCIPQPPGADQQLSAFPSTTPDSFGGLPPKQRVVPTDPFVQPPGVSRPVPSLPVPQSVSSETFGSPRTLMTPDPYSQITLTPEAMSNEHYMQSPSIQRPLNSEACSGSTPKPRLVPAEPPARSPTPSRSFSTDPYTHPPLAPRVLPSASYAYPTNTPISVATDQYTQSPPTSITFSQEPFHHSPIAHSLSREGFGISEKSVTNSPSQLSPAPRCSPLPNTGTFDARLPHMPGQGPTMHSPTIQSPVLSSPRLLSPPRTWSQGDQESKGFPTVPQTVAVASGQQLGQQDTLEELKKQKQEPANLTRQLIPGLGPSPWPRQLSLPPGIPTNKPPPPYPTAPHQPSTGSGTLLSTQFGQVSCRSGSTSASSPFQVEMQHGYVPETERHTPRVSLPMDLAFQPNRPDNPTVPVRHTPPSSTPQLIGSFSTTQRPTLINAVRSVRPVRTGAPFQPHGIAGQIVHHGQYYIELRHNTDLRPRLPLRLPGQPVDLNSNAEQSWAPRPHPEHQQQTKLQRPLTSPFPTPPITSAATQLQTSPAVDAHTACSSSSNFTPLPNSGVDSQGVTPTSTVCASGQVSGVTHPLPSGGIEIEAALAAHKALEEEEELDSLGLGPVVGKNDAELTLDGLEESADPHLDDFLRSGEFNILEYLADKKDVFGDLPLVDNLEEQGRVERAIVTESQRAGLISLPGNQIGVPKVSAASGETFGGQTAQNLMWHGGIDSTATNKTEKRVAESSESIPRQITYQKPIDGSVILPGTVNVGDSGMHSISRHPVPNVTAVAEGSKSTWNSVEQTCGGGGVGLLTSSGPKLSTHQAISLPDNSCPMEKIPAQQPPVSAEDGDQPAVQARQAAECFSSIDFDKLTPGDISDPIARAKMIALKGIKKVVAQSSIALHRPGFPPAITHPSPPAETCPSVKVLPQEEVANAAEAVKQIQQTKGHSTLDEKQRKQHEEWLLDTQGLLAMQQRLLEEQIAAHRKARKALSAKQRTARKAGRELVSADAEHLKQVTEQQGHVQKQLQQVKKQQKEHAELMEEFRNKQWHLSQREKEFGSGQTASHRNPLAIGRKELPHCGISALRPVAQEQTPGHMAVAPWAMVSASEQPCTRVASVVQQASMEAVLKQQQRLQNGAAQPCMLPKLTVGEQPQYQPMTLSRVHPICPPEAQLKPQQTGMHLPPGMQTGMQTTLHTQHQMTANPTMTPQQQHQVQHHQFQQQRYQHQLMQNEVVQTEGSNPTALATIQLGSVQEQRVPLTNSQQLPPPTALQINCSPTTMQGHTVEPQHRVEAGLKLSEGQQVGLTEPFLIDGLSGQMNGQQTVALTFSTSVTTLDSLEQRRVQCVSQPISGQVPRVYPGYSASLSGTTQLYLSSISNDKKPSKQGDDIEAKMDFHGFATAPGEPHLRSSRNEGRNYSETTSRLKTVIPEHPRTSEHCQSFGRQQSFPETEMRRREVKQESGVWSTQPCQVLKSQPIASPTDRQSSTPIHRTTDDGRMELGHQLLKRLLQTRNPAVARLQASEEEDQQQALWQFQRWQQDCNKTEGQGQVENADARSQKCASRVVNPECPVYDTPARPAEPKVKHIHHKADALVVKRRRKGEEDQLEISSGKEAVFSHLKQLPLLPLVEPVIEVSLELLAPFGAGRLDGESRLRGSYGQAVLDGGPDYYLQLYCEKNMSDPPTPPLSLPPTPPPGGRSKLLNGFAAPEEMSVKRALYIGQEGSTESHCQLTLMFPGAQLVPGPGTRPIQPIDVPASFPTPPHSHPEDGRLCSESRDERDSPDSVVPASSPESVLGPEEPSRFPDLGEIPPEPCLSPVIPILPSATNTVESLGGRLSSLPVVPLKDPGRLCGPPIPRNAQRLNQTSITLTLSASAAENISGVVTAVAELLGVTVPKSYEVRDSPAAHTMLDHFSLLPSLSTCRGPAHTDQRCATRPEWCRHCDVSVMGAGVRKAGKDLPGHRQDSADGSESPESEVVFCSNACFMQYALVLQAKQGSTAGGEQARGGGMADTATNVLHHYRSGSPGLFKSSRSPGIEKRQLGLAPHLPSPQMPHSLPSPSPTSIMEAEVKSEVPKLSHKVKLSSIEPKVENECGVDIGDSLGKRWKGLRWRRWDIKTIPPLTTGGFRPSSEDEMEELMRKLGTSLKPEAMPCDKRRCCLCQERGDGSTDGPARLLNLDLDMWVHLNCALWSSEVYETQAGALMNVDIAASRGLITRCLVCQHPGATTSCNRLRCMNTFHFSCALRARCTFFKDKTVLCPVHRLRGDACDLELSCFSVFRRVFVYRNELQQLSEMLQRSDGTQTFRVGSLIFRSLGYLHPHCLEAFHSPLAIFPRGFETTRLYWSTRYTNKRCYYHCQIGEVDLKPEFTVRVVEQGHDDLVLVGGTPKAVWEKVLEPISRLRKDANMLRLFPDYARGEDMFGLTVSAVRRIIESLPGADSCHNYTFRFGRHLLMELPLAINPSGCARCEPRVHCSRANRPFTLNTTSTSKSFQSTVTGDLNAPYGKQFVHSKSSQYRRLRSEWKNNVYLARSDIQGLGLYAARDIEKHTMVIEYIGTVIRNEVADRRENVYKAQNRGMYMFRVDSGHVIDATLTGGPARYINHSCLPNCVAEVVNFDKERSKIIIISSHKIQKGEELTYDYKFDSDQDRHKIPCLCRAQNCRKWMN
uniref:histone-lysine N-methyltransferase 2C-like isoform X2 n=1 Tax=Myxine glutinosa TaxID=7769 RepID=UPI00358F6248